MASFRYGYTVFPDGRNCRGGSPGKGCFSDGLASLGFNQTYLNAVDAHREEPVSQRSRSRTSPPAGQNLNTAPIKWESPITLNARAVEAGRPPHVKFGGDYRSMRLDTTLLNNTAGTFSFQNLFTAGPNRVGGYDYASFLLGAPTTGVGRFQPRRRRLFAAIRRRLRAGRLARELAVHAQLRRALRARERAAGEATTTSPWDSIPNATSPELQAIDAAIRRNGYTGPALKGGLMFAGVNGANDYQGNPPAREGVAAPGRDLGARRQHGRSRRLRPVLRALAVHAAEPRHDRLHALDGDAQSAAESAVPLVTLDNPFPAGLIAPTGSSLGILTGVGGNIDFIDQNKGAPQGAPVRRRRPAPAARRHGGVGRLHRIDRPRHRLRRVHQHRHRDQSDRSGEPAQGRERAMGCGRAAAIGAESVLRRARAPASSAPAPTILAGQLLRPFPQFNNVTKFQMTEGGRRQYHAMVLKLDKRTTGAGAGTSTTRGAG